ncbi:hypothetical protein D3C78_1685110 [compost metagenome]
MVRVLPIQVLPEIGKPCTTPPLIIWTPEMLRLCRPSGAFTVKVPCWVSAGASGSLP